MSNAERSGDNVMALHPWDVLSGGLPLQPQALPALEPRQSGFYAGHEVSLTPAPTDTLAMVVFSRDLMKGTLMQVAALKLDTRVNSQVSGRGEHVGFKPALRAVIMQPKTQNGDKVGKRL